jgi:hypothetical protein
MRQDKDRVTKWMLSHHGDSILRLAGITGFARWKAVQPETVAPRRLPDGLLEVTFPGEKTPDLVLVEVETYPSADADRQVFEDVLLVTLDRGVVPTAVTLVLQPRGHQVVRGTAERTDRRGTTRVSATWSAVNVWEVRAEDLLAVGDPGLIPWVPLAATDRPADEVLAECRDRLMAVPDPGDRASLMAVTAVLAGLAYPGRRLLDLFGGVQAMIESPVLDEVTEVIRARTVRGTVVSFLEARFGSVPDDVRSAVGGVTDPARLESLVRLAATCPDVAAFAAGLAAGS